MEGRLPSEWWSGRDRASLRAFLERGIDHLVVCVPLTGETRGLVGAGELEILGRRSGALVTNVSRGEVLDQEALGRELRRWVEGEGGGEGGRKRMGLRGAALDVTDPEPLPPDHPLWDAPNCIVCVSSAFSRLFLTFLFHSVFCLFAHFFSSLSPTAPLRAQLLVCPWPASITSFPPPLGHNFSVLDLFIDFSPPFSFRTLLWFTISLLPRFFRSMFSVSSAVTLRFFFSFLYYIFHSLFLPHHCPSSQSPVIPLCFDFSSSS